MSTVMNVFKKIIRFLESVGRVLRVLVWIFIIGVIVAASGHKGPTVPADHYALLVHPMGQLVEQLSDSPLSLSELAVASDGQTETLLRDLVAAIATAATDNHVKCIVLDVSDLEHSGLSKVKTLADALAEFKKHGKKVYAYSRVASQEQYYLLAQADQLMLDPMGEIQLVGVASYNLYMHAALDKLGVDVNVFKVGTHKSYPETFVRQDMSKEDREQTKALIDPIWQVYATGVEQARQLKAGEIELMVQTSVDEIKALKGDVARWALSHKLVNILGTGQDFEQQLIAEVGEDKQSHSFNALDADEYLQLHPNSSAHSAKQNVAVLVAAGDIVDGEAPKGQIGGDTLARLLRQARFDDSVKAVVLRIDSGGGSMLASETIRREVTALQEAHKPVVASMSSVAASGGYYIAMSADKILAEPETITGSIGVFAIIPTFQHTLEKVGVSSDGVSTSPLAGMLSLERSLTPEVKTILQVGVEHAYHDFVTLVAKSRHAEYSAVEPIAEGKVYLAPQALKLGLIDELGGEAKAIEVAAKLASLTEGYGVDYREREPTWRDMLAKVIRDNRSEQEKASGIGVMVNRFMHSPEVRQLQALNDPKHLYATCGCQMP